MISIRNILTISKYESKVVWRNWFFRILAIGVLFFLTMFNLAAFSLIDETPNWFIISNSWGIPYANMILLSMPQAAAIIFLGTGLVKKNKKLDTNEVFYTRSISNADYVFGKALALFKLLIILNVVILSMSLIFNLTNPNAPFNVMGYLIYPVIVSVPSIIFTTGLAFFFVTLFRNQPVSIVLLLGLSGVILIYFQGKHSNILDYMAFRFTMMASDIAGFSDLKFILFQRLSYLTAGVAFLFGTAFFLDRLTNHKRIRLAVGLISLLLAGLSVYLFINVWDIRSKTIELRSDLIAVNGEWAEVPNIDITSNTINLDHSGNEISASAQLVANNSNIQPLETIYFTLNPGLTVSEVAIDGNPTDFKRNQHIISIDDVRIEPGAELNVQIDYQGTVLDEVAHLEVKQKRYDIIHDDFVYPIQKRYAFLQPDYVLLTKDVLWYPDTQIGYSREAPIKDRRTFTDFELNVKVAAGLTAVSQGKMTRNDDSFGFNPEFPLPQISLAIGKYEEKKITVDSIDYVVYHYPGHDYFSKQFDLIGDTLDLLVKDLVNGYAFDQKIKYPFKRLQFVETPIQYRAFTKIYEGHQAYIQPEMVLYPEKGGNSREFDFNRQRINMNRQAREENQVMGDKEKQANVFTDFVKKVFTRQLSSRRFFFDGRDADDHNFSIFPNLYAYNTGIISDDRALLNKSISSYLNEDDLTFTDFSRNINGISFTEECNELMANSSITEILTEEEEFNKIQKSISLKGEYLFSYLGQIIGEEQFKSFLYDWVNSNQHQLTDYDDLSNAIDQAFDLNIDPIIQQVFSETDQPSFLISNTQEYEILDGDRKRYQVLFDVTNSGDNHGVIKVNFKSEADFSESGFFRRRNDDEDKTDDPGYLSVVNMGETKQLGFVLDEKPGQISINTLVSKNIPSVISMPAGEYALKENFQPFEGERPVTKRPVATQYEVIVDNEDPGFSSFSPIKDTYLKEFLDKRNPTTKKYYGVWRRSYSKWLATTGSNFYGQYIRSAHFTRSGSGDKITTWTPELKEEGFYDLYVYMMGKNQNSFGGRSRNNRTYTYQYIINHADGKDEITFNVSNAERGWNYLGSYYFQEAGGSVNLTDKCDLRSVYADAIKWVKQ